jgi:hypothetical protein
MAPRGSPWQRSDAPGSPSYCRSLADLCRFLWPWWRSTLLLLLLTTLLCATAAVTVSVSPRLLYTNTSAATIMPSGAERAGRARRSVTQTNVGHIKAQYWCWCHLRTNKDIVVVLWVGLKAFLTPNPFS